MLPKDLSFCLCAKNKQQGQKNAELSKSIEGKLLTATQKVQKDQCLQKERESKAKIWANDQMIDK